jgi:hypothetical protein
MGIATAQRASGQGGDGASLSRFWPGAVTGTDWSHSQLAAVE